MKFFLDTADLDEIEEAASWGVLAGVTTNPTLYARTGGKLDDFHNHIKRICEIVDGPVSAESVAMTRDEIIRDGRELAALADNVVVKIPTMVEGLAATKALSEEGIPVNMTLCFSVPQAIMPPAPAPLHQPLRRPVRRHRRGRHLAVGRRGGRGEQLRLRPRRGDHRRVGAQREPRDAGASWRRHRTVPFAALKKCVQHPLTDRGWMRS